MSDTLDMCIASRLTELDRVRLAVETFLQGQGVAGRPIYHILLALDELITNIISYGYRDADEHLIRLTLTRRPDLVDILLIDDAMPFNPLDAPEPDTTAALEDRRIGGLGIHFVRKIMDFAAYERRGGNNILRLAKKTT